MSTVANTQQFKNDRDEPSVFPEGEFAKHLAAKSMEYGATSQQEKKLNDGITELRLYNSTGIMTCRFIVDQDREKILAEEAFNSNGKIWKRWTSNISETFDENGVLVEKTIFGDDTHTIQRFKDTFYGADGVPAIEVYSGATKLEETWYEGVKELGKPVKYGMKNRRATKDGGGWKFKPTKLLFDPSEKKCKAFIYLEDVLTDAPDGTPAFEEWLIEKPAERSSVHIKEGKLHGLPAISGRENGVAYEINAENGKVSDVPSVPGMVLKKDNLTLNVRFSADGTVQSKDVVIDLRDANIELHGSEIDELAQLLGGHLEAMVTRRYVKESHEASQDSDSNAIALQDFY